MKKYMKLLSVSMVLIMMTGLSFELNTAVYAEGTIEPDLIEVELNGEEVVYPPAIMVKNNDTLSFQIHFSNVNEGETFLVALPAIFDGINENMFNSNPLVTAGDASLVSFLDNTQGETEIEIKFDRDLITTSFTFSATLNITNNQDYDENITIGTIKIPIHHIATTPGDNTSLDIHNRPVKPEDISILQKGGRNTNHTITESQMQANTIEDAYNYILRLNYGMTDSTMDGTLTDELPLGMKLFMPGEPDDEITTYQEAFQSFQITRTESLVKFDVDQYYMELSTAERNSYLSRVFDLEKIQGRLDDVVVNNPYHLEQSPKVYISDDIAQQLKNDDTGLFAYHSPFDIGYRINDTTKTITFYVITDDADPGPGSGYSYEENRSTPWSDISNTSCVPLYIIKDDELDDVTEKATVRDNEVQAYHGVLRNGFSRSQPVEISSGVYQWEYYSEADGNKRLEFTLTAGSMPNGQDVFTVKMNTTDDTSYFHNASFAIRPRIYFDQSLWETPFDGEKEFYNQATYETENGIGNDNGEYTSTYTYLFYGSGTAIRSVEKTVDKNNIERNGTLTYGISFTKDGDEAIDENRFKVFDKLDKQLDFVNGTIKIYVNGQLATENVTGYTADSSGSPDVWNFFVEYNPQTSVLSVGNSDGSITALDGTTIKVEFQVKLKEDTRYGTIVTNSFGNQTVRTYVDHRLNIKKVDKTGSVINVPTQFSVQYTTDDYTNINASLYPLIDTLGNPFSASITTGSDGIASRDYRLNEDVFYLKIDEVQPPDGYTGIYDPIWIKAIRNETGDMEYNLVSASDETTVSMDDDGAVTVTISNTKTKLPNDGTTEQPPISPSNQKPVTPISTSDLNPLQTGDDTNPLSYLIALVVSVLVILCVPVVHKWGQFKETR